MTIGILFLESLSTGVISATELTWIAMNQNNFDECERNTAMQLGEMLDGGQINLGCRI